MHADERGLLRRTYLDPELSASIRSPVMPLRPLAAIDQTAARLRLNRMLAALGPGLWLAAAVAGGLSVARFTTDGLLPWWVPLVGAAAIIAVVTLQSWLRPVDKIDAARRIDTHYCWPSVAVTALSLVAKPHRREAEEMALASAASRLEKARPAEVVPYRPPRRWFASGTLLIVAVAAAFVPPPSSYDVTIELQPLRSEEDPFAAVKDLRVPRAEDAIAGAGPAISPGETPFEPPANFGAAISQTVTERYFDQRAKRDPAPPE